MTAGLRIKQRAVTTQEAAVEDDRSWATDRHSGCEWATDEYTL